MVSETGRSSSAAVCAKTGAPDRSQTGDFPLDRRALWSLSYEGMRVVRPEGFEPPTPSFVAKCSGPAELRAYISGATYRIRTGVLTLKGWCPRPLDECCMLNLAPMKGIEPS